MQTLKTYYYLTKPGIIRGNLLTAVAGFLLASKGNVDFEILVAVTAGVSLIIASACVVNNFTDINIDKKMDRTKKRALVTGEISKVNAIKYAAALGITGLGILLLFTNYLTALLGVVAYVFYVVIYGYAKRTSVHGTLVGAVPGALSLVAGYTAVTASLDLAAWILFLIMVIWQMPHFYAISVYRYKDYKAAGLPVLSVVKGISQTKLEIVAYIGLYVFTVTLLTLFGYTGIVYLAGMLVISIAWFWYAYKGYNKADSDKWAKGVFGYSLIVLLIFCLLISVDSFLP